MACGPGNRIRTRRNPHPPGSDVKSEDEAPSLATFFVNKALLNLLNILAPALVNSFSFRGLKTISSNPHNPGRTEGGGFFIHPAIQSLWSLVKGCSVDGAWGEKEWGGSRASAWQWLAGFLLVTVACKIFMRQHTGSFL